MCALRGCAMSLSPQWLSEGHTEAPPERQAEHGKTELSLMRFALSNPRWRPPPPARRFLGHLQAQVTRDAATAPPPRHLLAEGPLAASLLSEDSALAVSGGASGGYGMFWVSP